MPPETDFKDPQAILTRMDLGIQDKDCVTIQSAQGKLLYANQAAAEILGFDSVPALLGASTEEILSKFELFDESGNPADPSSLPGRRALRGERPDEAIFRFKIKKTGEERLSRVKALPILDAEGKTQFAVNIFRDITFEERIEELVKRSEKDFKDFFENATIGLHWVGPDGTILRANKAELGMLGYESEEYIGRNIRDFYKNREKADEILARLARNEEIINLEVEMVGKDGGTRTVVISSNVLWRNGKFVHSRCFTRDVTERRRIESQIRYQASLLDNISDAVVATDRSHTITLWNSGAEALYGWKREEVVGRNASEIIPTSYPQNNREEVLAQIFEQGSWKGEVIQKTKEGREVDILASVSAVRDASGSVIGGIAVNRDISARKRAERLQQDLLEHLKESEETLNRVQQIANLGSWEWDLGLDKMRLSNHMCKILGCDQQEWFERDILRQYIHPEDRERMVALVARSLKEGGFSSEFRIVRGDGEQRWVLAQGNTVFADGKPVKSLGTILDVTPLKDKEAQIRHQAFYDSLTGLPNRNCFEQHVGEAIREADEEKGQFAVLVLDLDRFKVVNDTLGSKIGDELLKEAALRLESCVVKKNDVVARLGGDEFAVLATRIGSGKDVAKLAKKILACLKPAIRVNSHSFHVSASIGVAFYPNDAKDVHELVKNADLALYRAKEYGRARYQMYDESMNLQATRRLGLEIDLHNAIRNDELCFYYQPIVDIKQNKIVEIEALMRWNHPQLGLLAPGDFVSIAEETGLIIPMSRVLLGKGLKDLRHWRDSGLTVPRLAVNLSPRQFSDARLIESIEEALSQEGLEPESLDVEITESIAMANIDRTTQKLRALKAMGVKITIDDFGTGYSSLNYLKRFPLDKLKIDKSFVKHAVHEEQDASIVETIISIGHALKLKVVAEGVESMKQVNLLSRMGCDKVQGYFVSPPISAEEMSRWLKVRQNELFPATDGQ